MTAWSRPSGPYERASDPSIAYDARHATWLAASLVLGDDGTGIVVSRAPATVSPGGRPVVAASGVGENPDKNWIVCDNWPGSPGRGTCYLAVLRRGRGARGPYLA